MSVLDDLMQVALKNNAAADPAQVQGQGTDLLKTAMDLLDRMGGIQGLTEKFQQSGLGDLVASWVGTGQNQPVTGEQITEVLGQEQVEAISQKANVPAGQGSSILAELLPVLIDKLTPNGQVPDQSQFGEIGKTILSGLAAAMAPKNQA